MARLINNKIFKPRFVFWILAAFLFIIFLTGGSSRSDVASLAILYPITVGILGHTLWMLQRPHIKANWFLVWSAISVFVWLVIQLIPLHAVVWNSLPGRDIVVSIDSAVTNQGIWRPLSLAHAITTNALYAFSIPLTVLLLVIQLNREERQMILPFVLGLGLFSGFLGLLQAVGNADGPLYLYRITNNGSSVGLFANRNHQAVMLSCLFPMLAVFASTKLNTAVQAKYKAIIAISAGVVLVPLLLVTGSRAGFLLGILGLALAFLLYKDPLAIAASNRKASSPKIYYVFCTVAVFALGAMTVIFSRGKALERLVSQEDDGSRWEVWRHTAAFAFDYFPFGTGTGTFSLIYQIHEPDDMLRSVFINQAHNDFLDLYLTSGISGLVLIVVCIIGFVSDAQNQFRLTSNSNTNISFRRLGAVTLLLILLGSLADYSLRTPIMGALFAIALGWLIAGNNHKVEKAGTM